PQPPTVRRPPAAITETWSLLPLRPSTMPSTPSKTSPAGQRLRPARNNLRVTLRLFRGGERKAQVIPRGRTESSGYSAGIRKLRLFRGNTKAQFIPQDRRGRAQ